jgi:hypothetical protein
LTFLAALNVADPDAIVANLNVSRAERLAPGMGPALDLEHLASLGGRGAAIAVDAVVHADVANPTGSMPNPSVVRRCVAARMLVGRWGPQSGPRRHAESTGGWRYWNRDDALAFRAFDAHSAELQRFANEGCAPPDPH